MKAYRGRSRKTLRIPDLGSRYKWSASSSYQLSLEETVHDIIAGGGGGGGP